MALWPGPGYEGGARSWGPGQTLCSDLLGGMGRLQQPDREGCLPLDLSRWPHSSGTTAAVLGCMCLAQLRTRTQSQVTPSALHVGNTADADETHLPSRHTVLPAPSHRLESRDLQSTHVQAAVEMLVSHCESGTAYLPPPGVGVRLSQSS